MKKIYVIDDDRDLCVIIKNVFKKSKYSIELFYEGGVALQKIKQSPPDMVLLDLELPDMDGLEICDIIKNSDLGGDIPVVMLTGRSAQHDKLAGLIIGADDYITKPFNKMELLARVEAVLRRYSMKNDNMATVNSK